MPDKSQRHRPSPDRSRLRAHAFHPSGPVPHINKVPQGLYRSLIRNKDSTLENQARTAATMRATQPAVGASRSNVALLIVDLQIGFISPYSAHIVPIIESIQNDYDLVIATRFVNPPVSNYRKIIGWHGFSEGSDETKLAFKPTAECLVIEKNIYSCIDKMFVRHLLNHRICTVHICGLDTDVCITKCAVDLFEYGFRPCIIENACASHLGFDKHRIAIDSIRRFIGDDQIIYDN